MGGSTLPVGMVWNYIGGIGIELNRRSQIPIFFFKSPPLRAVIASDKTKISSISKTCDMSDLSVRRLNQF